MAVDGEDNSRVVAARRNSPLVVGLGDGENFVGSDVAAFIEHTREALELGQDQVVTITREGVEVTGFDGSPAEGRPYHVDWDLSAAEKDGHDWFMRKEIFEQPHAVADALLGRHTAGGQLQLDEMRLSEQELRDVDKIIVIACGTAFYAGLVAKYAIEHWTRIPCEVELAHEFRYRDPILTQDTLVVAISQSGETADTLMAIRHAREQGSRVLAICNTNGSTIPRESDAVIYTHAGPEIGVASTKGFTTQLVASYLLGLYLAQVRGNKFGDEIAAVVTELERMPAHLQGILDRKDAIYALADELAGARSVLFLGRHAGFPVALEGALKLKELAYIHAEGFAAGELKHGPIALIEEGLPVFCVVPPQGRDQLHDKMISAIQEIRARGARTILLAEEGDPAVAPYADSVIYLPRVPVLLAAAGGRRTPAALRLPARQQHGPRRRPATQPGQVRHGRIERRQRGHHRRRHRRGRPRPLRRVPGAHPRPSRAAVHARGGDPRHGVAGGPVCRQGGAGQGPRGAGRPRLARRRGVHRGHRPPAPDHAGHGQGPRRGARGPARPSVALPRRRHRLGGRRAGVLKLVADGSR